MKKSLWLVFYIVFCSCLFVQCKKKHVTNDICDCSATQSSYMVDTLTLTVPNIFTPNGDIKNDVWMIKNINGFPDCKVKVTRPGLFGGKVFESNGYGGNQFWNGNNENNKSLKDGKYNYEITIGDKTITGYVCIYRGDVDLENKDCLKACVFIDNDDPFLN